MNSTFLVSDIKTASAVSVWRMDSARTAQETSVHIWMDPGVYVQREQQVS